MKFVFLTNRDKSHLIKLILEEKFTVSAVILPFKSSQEKALSPLISLAEKENIPVYRVRVRELKELLIKLSPDIPLSAGYPYLLTSEHLSIAKYNLNIHPTLLPKYRGPATHWHIVANGEEETGLTIHEIDEGMDTGPILVQEKVSLTPFDTIKTIMEKTMPLEPIAFRKALKLIKNNELTLTPQDESIASTYTKMLTPEDSVMDPEKSLLDLYNHIRACDPDRFPAFFEYEGKRIGVKLFELPDKD
jgi:methionyl-tRNA formyltransferase